MLNRPRLMFADDRSGGERLAYRPDLDGLRGIAIASVVAYHLGGQYAPGGFVGVDIFFVLSGFLITRLIADDLQRGRFSFLGFYERRIRRIMPALVFICACVTVIAFALLLPNELKTYCSSLIAALFSFSNLWFHRHSDYFAPKAETQPLLHTWSLGVEEQFYILFPLLMWAIFTVSRRRAGAIIWCLLAVSLLISVVGQPYYPKRTFFLLHARAWELLAGSVVALGLVPTAHARWQREIAGALGLAAIAAAVFCYTSQTPFPGAAALLPCIGTALVIWAGNGPTAVGTALSFRPLVFLGLISYSLYLWHWPLIVFTRLETGGVLSPSQQVALAAACVALAIVTWWFVERPFRRRGPRGFGRRTIFASGGLGIATLSAAAAGVMLLHGLPQRFPKEVLAIAAASHDISPWRGKCHFVGRLRRRFDDTCAIGAAVAPTIIVYGDSHGDELAAALASYAKSKGASIRQITANTCPPAAGYAKLTRPQCATYNAAILKRLVSIRPATIILVANSVAWNSIPGYWQGMAETIRVLRGAGHRVIVMGPIPPHPGGLSVPQVLARWILQGKNANDYVFDPNMGAFLKVQAQLKDLTVAEHATFVPLAPIFCDDKVCHAYLDNTVLYSDDNHPSFAGATLFAGKALVPLLWPASPLSQMAGEHASR